MSKLEVKSEVGKRVTVSTIAEEGGIGYCPYYMFFALGDKDRDTEGGFGSSDRNIERWVLTRDGIKLIANTYERKAKFLMEGVAEIEKCLGDDTK